MDDRYELYGCVDFGTDSYAISVPLLRRRNSNYAYIPKTDNHFIVLDFYECLEVGYAARSVGPGDERWVHIGAKSPVPILQHGTIYIVDPDWTEAEIRSRLPALENEAIKAFVSLRSRMGTEAGPTDFDDINAAIDELLVEPIRSRYWISKFSALVRSAFVRGRPSPEVLTRFESARLKWLDKFAAKSSLKMVEGIMNVPDLQLQSASANRLLLWRFERMLLTAGLSISKADLSGYALQFPAGIFDAIKEETGGEYEFWRRRKAISDAIAEQTYQLLHPSDSTRSRISLPKRWSNSELTTLLNFFETVGRNDTALDTSRQFFIPLFEKCHEQLSVVLGDRYRLLSAVFRTKPVASWFAQEILETLDIQASQWPSTADQWLAALRKIVELYRKLVIASKIVHPNTSKLDDSSIAFKGIDYALLDAINKALAADDISALRSLATPVISSKPPSETV